MSAADGDTRKRKKNFYRGSQAGGKRPRRGNALDSTSGPGFLVTFNPRQERRATLTAYSLLNEAADRLYGEQDEKSTQLKDGDKTLKEDDNVDDIEAELKSLREENYRFSKLRTEIPSIVFISTKLPKPIEICTDVFEHMPNNVQHIVRFLPVAATCKTQPECITKKVVEVLTEQYPVLLSKLSFLIQLKARHNNEYTSSETRRAFCLELAKKIQEVNADFVPDLKEPELVINIDVLQKVCCVSLLPHFARFKKYNPEQFNVGPNVEVKSDGKNGEEPVGKVGEEKVKSDKVEKQTPPEKPTEDGVAKGDSSEKKDESAGDAV